MTRPCACGVLPAQRPVADRHGGSQLLQAKREDVQPIRTDLANMLREWMTDRPADARRAGGKGHRQRCLPEFE